MFKSIIWNNSIHVLGPDTGIDIEEAAIKLTSHSRLVLLRYTDSPILMKRCLEDAQFKQLLPRIVMRHFVEFFTNEKMVVMDLVASILKTQIVMEPPPVTTDGLIAASDNAR